ncbi:uncharacterized protein LOC130434611 isoform X4 [Triplophysa dalaica]|uniref:uncharacterized protein LOC130434611 isoform X4 n=1 Tax=Triplophysa dalaica TaxID=1582913 RepID=UPI0024DF4A55|nr:uncharacterized protein LOC130434611 isoform X4 [Triplophysa dalaica]
MELALDFPCRCTRCGERILKMQGNWKTTKVLGMLMLANFLIYMLVAVSRTYSQNNHKHRKAISKGFWKKPEAMTPIWNQEQQRLDDVYFLPVANGSESFHGFLRIPHWLNTSHMSSCQRDDKVMTQIKNFSSLPQRFKDFLLYRDCRSFPLIKDAPSVCSKPPFLLLAIKSIAPHFDRRQAIRESWGRAGLLDDHRIATVFLLGDTAATDHFPDLSNMVKHEAMLHGDVLQWDYRDSFFNLTLKEVLFLEWFATNCSSAQYVFKGDDDVFVNTHHILEYLRNLTAASSRDLFIGDVISNAGPHRDKKLKYYIPESVFVGDYPPYAGGGGYLYSGNLGMRLRTISRLVTLYPIDDVYTGMSLRRLGLAPQKHTGFKTFGIEEKYKDNVCAYKNLMLVHPRSPQEMIKIWFGINDPETHSAGAKERYAFFALRSCHQVLRGESGELFSPDYLCANPPVWCNWTIQVHPGKRVELYLEDFTPSEACHMKSDQIHLDESPAAAGGQRILERCWRKAQYMSVSNTVQVVLLIGGNRPTPYRGFYGRFKAFGPLDSIDPLYEEVPLDVIEEALGGGERETDAVTNAPSAVGGITADIKLSDVNAQTTSHGLTKPIIFTQFESTSVANGLVFKNRQPWEKSSGDVQEVSASSTNSTLTSGYPSDVEFLEDTHYDYSSIPIPREQQTPAGGSAQIRSKYQPAYRHITDMYLRPRVEIEATKPDARSPTAMRRNVDAHSRSSEKAQNQQTITNATQNNHLPGELLFEVAVEVSLDSEHLEKSSSLRNPLEIMVEFGGFVHHVGTVSENCCRTIHVRRSSVQYAEANRQDYQIPNQRNTGHHSLCVNGSLSVFE